MPVEFKNFPVVNVQKLLCSYMQEMFSREGIVPLEWRYDADAKKTKINIRTGFSEDIRTESVPSIILTRSTFSVENFSLNNLASASANDFASPSYRDNMNGNLDIICVSRSSFEAECIASFLALMFTTDRHQIMDSLNWISWISAEAIGPATTGKQDTDIRRWSVTLRLRVMLKVSWQRIYCEDDPTTGKVWSKLDAYNADLGNAFAGACTVEPVTDVLVDATADFGILNTNSPHLVEKELSKGFYYVFMKNVDTRFVVTEIIDNHRLRLTESNGTAFVPMSLAEGFVGDYKIAWNDSHFVVGL